jgi:hypothetical protein
MCIIQTTKNAALQDTVVDCSIKQENNLIFREESRWPDVCDFVDWLDKDWPDEMGHLTFKDVLKLSHSDKLP